MGTDDLLRRRGAKGVEWLQRRAAKRAPYTKILIVCEGEKTEPGYFREICDYYKLNTANVEVYGCGYDPVGVVEFARQRYRQEKDAGDPFDRVYCVFDRDDHARYGEALDILTSATPKETYHAIPSVPCFEYWLLLHYVYTTRPYETLPGNSACAQLLKELRTHMKRYRKGKQPLFATHIDQLEFAMENARRSLEAARQSGTDNPSTHVHELVEFMQGIREA